MKKHIFPVAIIFSLVFLAWNRILLHTFQGEGFYYFFERFSENGIVFRYDIGAGLLFDILMPVFKDNFFLYQSFSLLSFELICILFYFFVYELTKRKDISFIAGVLFGVNYATTFEMLGMGNYQNFVQRVFFLFLTFFSLILFLKFNKKGNIFYLLGSLILSIFSAFLAHFSIFYIVFFLVFALTNLYVVKKNPKKVLMNSLFALTIFIASFFVIQIPLLLGYSSHLQGNAQNIFSYVFFHWVDIIFNILRQLTIISIPDVFLRIVFGITNISYREGMHYLFVPILLAYIFVGLFLYRREKKFRVLIVNSVFFFLLVFMLNMYIRGDNVPNLWSGSRYLFAPSIGLAIFWGIFFAHFLGKLDKRLIYMLPIIWFAIQYISINRVINQDEYRHTATKKIVSYFKENSYKLKDDSIVIAPDIMANWGSWFCNLFYGKKNTFFTGRISSQIAGSDLKRRFDPSKDFIIGYDYNNEEVIDLTKNYKEIIIY